MICNCGIYSIKVGGAFNAPFVALHDNQAIDIVKQALDGGAYEGTICRLGTLDFYKGIIEATVTDVCDLSDIFVESAEDVSILNSADSSELLSEEDVDE